MRVLSVDDNEPNRFLVETIFNSEGHEVVSAVNGCEALDFLQSSDFDFIISDILMPVMDGYQFCSRVRADPKLRHLPFLFYTATYTEKKDKELARQLGADGFLVKPCEPDVLLAEAQRILERVVSDQREAVGVEVDYESPEGDTQKLYSERLVWKLEKKMLDLERSEDRYRRLFESIQDLVLTLDETQTVSTVNSQSLRFGVEPQYLIGRPLRDFVRKSDQGDLDVKLQRLSDGVDANVALELGLEVKPGQLCMVEMDVFLVQKQNHLEGFLVLVRDVTQRLAMERRLQRTAKMETMGRLTSDISHDFNNLLTVVQGQAEMLLLDPILPKQLLGETENLFQATQKASRLVNRLLDVGRSRESHSKVQDLNAVVDDLRWMIERLAGKIIKTKFQIGKGLQPVKVDREKLERVILNLITNAVYEMPKGGDLIIKTTAHDGLNPKWGAVGDRNSGAFVELSISDSGGGIPVDVQQRIFEPYFTTKESSGGTGLGLAIAQSMVHECNGFLMVDCPPEGGSIFRILLPGCLEFVALPEIEQSRLSFSEKNNLVLVVDDNPTGLELTTHMLHRGGYQVNSVSSTEEALRLLQIEDFAPSMVVCNTIMPGINGVQFLSKLREFWQDLPAVFLTSCSLVGKHSGETEVEGVVWLAKPFRQEDLFQATKMALA